MSVVVSAYNRPAMLRSALESLRDQTYPDLEILVQDDSTDDTCAEVIREFAEPRVSYTRNVPSLGTGQNLLAGYKKATGTYFATLNDDDLYGPAYIERMVEALERFPAAALAFSDHVLIDQNGVVDTEATQRNSELWKRSSLAEGLIAPALEVAIVDKSIPGMLAVFRRASVDLADFPAEVSSGYDYWLTYLAVRAGAPAYYTPDRLTSYRIHGGSQTANFSVQPARALEFNRYTIYTHRRFLADSRLASVHAALVPRLAAAHSAAGFALLRLGDRRGALAEFVSSLRTRFSPRALAGVGFCALPLGVLAALKSKAPAAD